MRDKISFTFVILILLYWQIPFCFSPVGLNSVELRSCIDLQKGVYALLSSD